MYRWIRFVDDLVDRVLTLGLILALLIGVYFIYDTAYVYYNAAARVTYSRPGRDEAAAGESRALTEDYEAWLQLDGSPIDYPIMQGETNNQYLNTDPYGDYSLAGSIFLDSRNAPDFSDEYSLVYGHHMSGDYMFGALDRFYDESYFREHQSGTLTVGDSVYPLQIFAVLHTEADNEQIFGIDGSDPALAAAKLASLYYREPVSRQVLALTTCVNSTSTSRTAVLCAMGESYTEGANDT